MQISHKYSDINYQLKANQFGGIQTEYDFESIKQSIKTILGTVVGERMMNPTFGSNFKSLLFEPMDVFTERLIEAEVSDSIERWEPRVAIRRVDVESDYVLKAYTVTIHFYVVDADQRNSSMEIKARQLA